MRTIERQKGAYLAGAFAPLSRVGLGRSAANPAERQQLLGLSFFFVHANIPTRPRNWNESESAASDTPRKAPIPLPTLDTAIGVRNTVARVIADCTR